MAQTTICIRIDADLKKDFEKFCDSIGMSMSTAVNIFIKKSVGEQRIPSRLRLNGIAKSRKIKQGLVACVTRPCKWLADGFKFKGFLCKLQTPYYKERDHARW